MKERLTGLVAACYTPMHGDGSLNLKPVPAIVDHLCACGVSALYVAGTSGEGPSLTADERRAVAEAFVAAAKGRLPVIVQIGHNSLFEARQLAAHAQQLGADALSAMPPSYFKPASVDLLVDCMADVASAAPQLPFYYYHIPVLTGVALDMGEFLEKAAARIPKLAGLKFSDPRLHEYHTCLAVAGQRYDAFWGLDEMLLGALAVGARGFVGSTYNIAAPLYLRIIQAFDEGRLDEARRLQLLSVRMIRALNACGPFHSSMKAVLNMIGLDCGACRLPLAPILPDAAARLRRDLETLGFFEWALPASHPLSRAR